MQEVTIKKNNKIHLEEEVGEFLNPKFIFLPIKKGYKLMVGDNEYVYKNDPVLMSPLDDTIFSSISGRVLGIKEMNYLNDKVISSLVIENDFKEKVRKRVGARKYINDYTEKEFYEVLNKYPITFHSKSVLTKINKIQETIIINAVELEPYFGNKNFSFQNKIDELLDTIDLLCRIKNIKKVLFVIKNNDSKNILELMNILGTYPHIELKLVSDAYPNGKDEVLKKLYEQKAVVFDVIEISYIYKVLKRNTPITHKLITVVGDAVSPSKVVKVKIGSLLSEVFTNCFDFTSKNIDVYLNGMMSGNIINHLKYVIDSNIDGIFVMPKQDKEIEACVNCGLCSKHCPMGLNPKYVFDHNGRVKPDYYNECIQCGLCNYVCPSNIDLKNAMKGSDKDEKRIQ